MGRPKSTLHLIIINNFPLLFVPLIALYGAPVLLQGTATIFVSTIKIYLISPSAGKLHF